MILPYECHSTHSRFLSTSTCSARIAKAASPFPLTIGKVFDAESYYAACKDCLGPIRVSDGLQVTVMPQMPPKRGFGASGKVDTTKSDHERAAEIRRNNMSRRWRFDHCGPDELWTGSTCGCTKARKHFRLMHTCIEHIREYDAERRRKKGIPKKDKDRKCACGNEYYAKGLCYQCYQIKWKAEKRNAR
jgi:hypothetical protein